MPAVLFKKDEGIQHLSSHILPGQCSQRELLWSFEIRNILFLSFCPLYEERFILQISLD